MARVSLLDATVWSGRNGALVPGAAAVEDRVYRANIFKWNRKQTRYEMNTRRMRTLLRAHDKNGN